MVIIIGENYEEMSLLAAQNVAAYINENPGKLLCFAAGTTPMGMFAKLIQMQNENLVNLSSVYYAELDEWVGLGYEDTGSCSQVMADNYYTPAGIPKERLHIFDGLDTDTKKQCNLMEEWIKKHGGLGLTVLGIGMNGHIGFNEPKAPDTYGCFTVALDDVTKKVSIKYFNKALPVEFGITIGWNMLKSANQVIFIADGEKKAPIVKASVEGAITDKVPASLLQNHANLTVILDKGSAAELQRKEV